jgi:hypothetical protein
VGSVEAVIDRRTLEIVIVLGHLTVAFAGFASLFLALVTGEWRWLIATAIAYWFTTRT